jgi:hypothetical protein
MATTPVVATYSAVVEFNRNPDRGWTAAQEQAGIIYVNILNGIGIGVNTHFYINATAVRDTYLAGEPIKETAKPYSSLDNMIIAGSFNTTTTQTISDSTRGLFPHPGRYPLTGAMLSNVYVVTEGSVSYYRISIASENIKLYNYTGINLDLYLFNRTDTNKYTPVSRSYIYFPIVYGQDRPIYYMSLAENGKSILTDFKVFKSPYYIDPASATLNIIVRGGDEEDISIYNKDTTWTIRDDKMTGSATIMLDDSVDLSSYSYISVWMSFVGKNIGRKPLALCNPSYLDLNTKKCPSYPAPKKCANKSGNIWIIVMLSIVILMMIIYMIRKR